MHPFTDLAFMLCVFYAETRISRVAISSGRARAISRNLVHSLKAKSVCKTCEIEGPHNNLKTLTVSFKTLTPPTLSPLQEIPANYQFRWDVLDGYTGNDFGQEEAR